MSIRDQLRASGSLKKQVEQEDQGKDDPRFLPYYKLDVNASLKVLLVPDERGNIWQKYSTIGGNMKTIDPTTRKERRISGIPTIGCRRLNANLEDPIADRMFDLYDQAKNAQTEAEQKRLKAEANRYQTNDTVLVSVLVLSAPFELPKTPNGNVVRLMKMPMKVFEMVKNVIAEDQIPDNELFFTPLVIKKTRAASGRNSYESSYFERKMVTDEELEQFDPAVLEQSGQHFEKYDYEKLTDIIPETPTEEECLAWLANVDEKLAKINVPSSNAVPAAMTPAAKEEPVAQQQQAPSVVTTTEQTVETTEPESVASEVVEAEEQATSAPLSERMARLINK